MKKRTFSFYVIGLGLLVFIFGCLGLIEVLPKFHNWDTISLTSVASGFVLILMGISLFASKIAATLIFLGSVIAIPIEIIHIASIGGEPKFLIPIAFLGSILIVVGIIYGIVERIRNSKV